MDVPSIKGGPSSNAKRKLTTGSPGLVGFSLNSPYTTPAIAPPAIAACDRAVERFRAGWHSISLSSSSSSCIALQAGCSWSLLNAGQTYTIPQRH